MKIIMVILFGMISLIKMEAVHMKKNGMTPQNHLLMRMGMEPMMPLIIGTSLLMTLSIVGDLNQITG